MNYQTFEKEFLGKGLFRMIIVFSTIIESSENKKATPTGMANV